MELQLTSAMASETQRRERERRVSEREQRAPFSAFKHKRGRGGKPGSIEEPRGVTLLHVVAHGTVAFTDME